MNKLLVSLLILLMFNGCSKDEIEKEAPDISSGQKEPYLFTITNKNTEKQLWLRETGMNYKPGETTDKLKANTPTPQIIYKLFVLDGDWSEYPTDTITVELQPEIINKIIIQ